MLKRHSYTYFLFKKIRVLLILISYLFLFGHKNWLRYTIVFTQIKVSIFNEIILILTSKIILSLKDNSQIIEYSK